MSTRLTPKQLGLLVAIRDRGSAYGWSGRSIDSLLRRGLVETCTVNKPHPTVHVASAYYRLTAAGATALDPDDPHEPQCDCGRPWCARIPGLAAVVTMPQPADRLTNAGAAAILGIRTDTWRGMVKRGQAPAADGVEPISGYRWWYRSTIEHFATHRRGRGFRSDLGPAGRKPIRPGRPDPVSY